MLFTHFSEVFLPHEVNLGGQNKYLEEGKLPYLLDRKLSFRVPYYVKQNAPIGNASNKLTIQAARSLKLTNKILFDRQFCSNSGQIRMRKNNGSDTFDDWLYGSPNEFWYGFKVGVSANRDLTFGVTATTNCGYCSVGVLDNTFRWQFATDRSYTKNDVNYILSSYDATFHITKNLSPQWALPNQCDSYLCN